jgi:hypothetical protein
MSNEKGHDDGERYEKKGPLSISRRYIPVFVYKN